MTIGKSRATLNRTRRCPLLNEKPRLVDTRRGFVLEAGTVYQTPMFSALAHGSFGASGSPF